MTITQAILTVLDEYLEHCDTPADVNTGGCYDFADDVHAIMPGATIRIEHDIHAFLCYDGQYYDSETPYGVSRPSELPFFKRMKG